MKTQSATTHCPQQRDGLVTSCPYTDARVQLSSLDLPPRDRFDWCLGPRTVALHEALLTGIERRGHLDLLDPVARASFDQKVDEASCLAAGEVEA